jgi:hypothetical protein
MTASSKRRTPSLPVIRDAPVQPAGGDISPYAWLPDYLPNDEMEAVWREWGWRVLGQEPVADEDREAFDIVCRQLHTNWGAVYRPVAILPPRTIQEGENPDEIQTLNWCLAAGYQLQHNGAPITVDALVAATGRSEAVITRLLPTIQTMIERAITHTTTGALSASA